MSFSKAKIQRFNDIKDCTPSPAKYNVATQERIKLGIIAKPDTYKIHDTSSKNSDAGSVHSTPCFQTPTVPIKRKKLLGITLSKTKTPSESKAAEEELRDKTVECINKDLYIQDLTEQIEELNAVVNNLKNENERLKSESSEFEGALVALQKQHNEDNLQRAKDYKQLFNEVEELSKSLRGIRHSHKNLTHSFDLTNVLAYVKKLQVLHEQNFQEQTEEFHRKQQEYEKTIKDLQTQHEELKLQQGQELEATTKNLEEATAKIQLLEENLNDVTVLTQLQTKEKIEEVETSWKAKLEAQEKESEAILKECQAISEYNIIQSEIEKNQFKNQAEDLKKTNQELITKTEELQTELAALKTEKHAYELSISTFKDTIEVLKKRLIDSDRDVEQLKEELEKCESRILKYEEKCAELTNQLGQTQLANEELEMQYESTSKLMQDQVQLIGKDLLMKVDKLKEESLAEKSQKVLLEDLMEQFHQQQVLVNEAQKVVAQSNTTIDSLEIELKHYQMKLDQESEEAAEIRKKYIEKSGKYDELAHQFEQILQELDQAKSKIQELEALIQPYQQKVESYQTQLQLLSEEKGVIEAEVQDLRVKYADILGHQNHSQKVKHLHDLKIKSSELFKKNIDLEAHNHKLSKTVEKLMGEIDDLRKLKKKDKENLASPKCIKGTHSPGPLKTKN